MSSKIAPLNRIIKFSNVDGPGNRMAIFFQECNFNCKYCHNPETINICGNCGKCILHCPTKALEKNNGKVIWDKERCVSCDECTKNCDRNSSPKTNMIDVDYLLTEIGKIKPFIKGITVSGGESSLRYEFLTELFTKVKEKWSDLTCFVDTNGSLDLSDEEYKDFVEVTDSFMLDVKSWDREEHIKLTDTDNDNVLKNLKYLFSIGKLFEVRTVVIPEFLSNEKTITNVSQIIKNSSIRYKLIKYRAIGVREELKPLMTSPSDEYMLQLKEITDKYQVEDVIII